MKQPKNPAASPATRATHRKAYSAPALEKGLDILELLAQEPDDLSQKDIAARLGRSVGEIFRMLAVLEQRDFVRLAPGDERYRLSMKLFQLAHWHLPVNRLIKAASGPMRHLALRTGQSCHITMLSGSNVVVLYKQDSFNDRSFSVRVGAESPILESCSGRMFFALADDPTQAALLTVIAENDANVSQAPVVSALAAGLRSDWILEVRSKQVEGITDIGTPVFDHDDTMVAGLVIPFLHRIDKDNADQLTEIREELVQTGHVISAALRGT